MRRRPRDSAALFHSLSEFAYIMLFLSLGACVLLYAESRQARARAAAYAAENERLAEEVAFLTDMLEEKRHGVVPCWRRPEGTIDKVAGSIVIHDEGWFTVVRGADGYTVDVREARPEAARSLRAAAGGTEVVDMEPETAGSAIEVLDDTVRRVLRGELRYAGKKNCYLRVAVENQTNDYKLYEEVTSVVTGAGMVVAHE